MITRSPVTVGGDTGVVNETNSPRYSGTGYPLPLVDDSLVRTDTNAYRLPERRAWPVPWINGDYGLDGDFHSFRDDHQRAETERLCCVCGNGLHATVVVAAENKRRSTSGGWSHPRCARLAVTMCPHFADSGDDEMVAWLHTGPGIGLAHGATFSVDDVAEECEPLTLALVAAIAADDPWGHHVWAAVGRSTGMPESVMVLSGQDTAASGGITG